MSGALGWFPCGRVPATLNRSRFDLHLWVWNPSFCRHTGWRQPFYIEIGFQLVPSGGPIPWLQNDFRFFQRSWKYRSNEILQNAVPNLMLKLFVSSTMPTFNWRPPPCICAQALRCCVCKIRQLDIFTYLLFVSMACFAAVIVVVPQDLLQLRI